MPQEPIAIDRNSAYVKITLAAIKAWLERVNYSLDSVILSNATAVLGEIVVGEAAPLSSCACYADKDALYPVFCVRHAAPLGSPQKRIIIAKCTDHGEEYSVIAWGKSFPVGLVPGFSDTLASAELLLNSFETEADAEREFMAGVARERESMMANMPGTMAMPPKKEYFN